MGTKNSTLRFPQFQVETQREVGAADESVRVAGCGLVTQGDEGKERERAPGFKKLITDPFCSSWTFFSFY